MVIKALIAEIHLRPKEEWKQGSNPLKEIVYNFPLENNPIEVFRGNTTSVHTKEQLLAMVREMVKTSVTVWIFAVAISPPKTGNRKKIQPCFPPR